jgi:transposase
VAVKTVQEQDVQALHRLRAAQVGKRTALCNQIRGLLAEYGIVLPKGVRVVHQRLPQLLEEGDNGLSAEWR